MVRQPDPRRPDSWIDRWLFSSPGPIKFADEIGGFLPRAFVGDTVKVRLAKAPK